MWYGVYLSLFADNKLNIQDASFIVVVIDDAQNVS